MPIADDTLYAVVDVETSGISPRRDRVLSLAVLLLDSDLNLTETWHTLLDPGVDPGPVHVHGLTREVLAGSPTFEDIYPHLSGLLADRVLVAHNAPFDSGFLKAESERLGKSLPIVGRLCTVVLARRLRLGTKCDLASLARHFGVRQVRAHDALDDTRVLVEIFRHLVLRAGERGVELLLLGERARRTPRWDDPPAGPLPEWTLGEPLPSGLRVALVGYGSARSATMRPLLSGRGLVPTGATDPSAQLVVLHGDPELSPELESFLAASVPVVSETELFSLLATPS